MSHTSEESDAYELMERLIHLIPCDASDEENIERVKEINIKKKILHNFNFWCLLLTGITRLDPEIIFPMGTGLPSHFLTHVVYVLRILEVLPPHHCIYNRNNNASTSFYIKDHRSDILEIFAALASVF